MGIKEQIAAFKKQNTTEAETKKPEVQSVAQDISIPLNEGSVTAKILEESAPPKKRTGASVFTAVKEAVKHLTEQNKKSAGIYKYQQSFTQYFIVASNKDQAAATILGIILEDKEWSLRQVPRQDLFEALVEEK